MEKKEEQESEVLKNWESKARIAGRGIFSLDRIQPIDESDEYLRDMVKPLYASKMLVVRVLASVLAAADVKGATDVLAIDFSESGSGE